MQNDLIPPEFISLNHAIELLWSLTESNSSQILEETIKFIEQKVITIVRVFDLISCMHTKPNEVLFPFCKQLANHFSISYANIPVRSSYLHAYLFYEGIIYSNSETNIHPKMAISVYPENSIQYAIKMDNLSMLQDICDTNKNFSPDQVIILSNVPNLCNRVTVLAAAAFYGAIQCFKFMVAKYPLKNSIYDKTMFLCAIIGNDFEIINICDQKQIEIDNIFLSYAIYYHNNQIASWLMEKYNFTINLMTSLTTLNLPFFFYHLSQLNNINERTSQNKAALQCAIITDSMEVLDYLCNNGADLNMPDEHNNPPLLISLIAEKYHISRFLIEKGANIECASKWMDYFANRPKGPKLSQMYNYILERMPNRTEDPAKTS